MSLSIIVAYAEESRIIGNLDQLPWHLPEDLLFFYRATVHKCVIMGRKTYESLPNALKDRTIFVLTRDKSYTASDPNVKVFTDVGKCLMMAELMSDSKEIMVAGGEEIYKLLLPYANKVYATIVYGHYTGDAKFPELPETEWRITKENLVGSENLELFYTRVVFERVTKTLDQ